MFLSIVFLFMLFQPLHGFPEALCKWSCHLPSDCGSGMGRVTDPVASVPSTCWVRPPLFIELANNLFQACDNLPDCVLTPGTNVKNSTWVFSGGKRSCKVGLNRIIYIH